MTWPHRREQVAAMTEASMISLFTLLVWGPAILAAPRTRLSWTAFFISWAIASAAWVVAQSVVAQNVVAQNVAPKQPAKAGGEPAAREAVGVSGTRPVS